MYYSEKLRSPISAHYIKKLYGINPDNTLVARKVGIYPLTPVASGFSVKSYKKVGQAYVAEAREFSDVKLKALRRLEAISADVSAIVSAHIADWSSSTTYATDDIVEHSGRVFKAKRASTNVEPGVFVPTLPDDVDPDWEFLH